MEKCLHIREVEEERTLAEDMVFPNRSKLRRVIGASVIRATTVEAVIVTFIKYWLIMGFKHYV